MKKKAAYLEGGLDPFLDPGAAEDLLVNPMVVSSYTPPWSTEPRCMGKLRSLFSLI